MDKTLILVLIITLFISCSKKEELVVDKMDSDRASQVIEDIEEVVSKPLIVVTKNDVVSILVRSDGYPGMYLDSDGEVKGFYVDLERMVMERMGQKFNFLPYDDVGIAAQALKTGTSHIALAVPDIPDYRAFLNLTTPYETLNYITFVQSDNTDITGENKEEVLRSLYGKRVGVQVTGQVFQNLRNIKEIELVEFPTTTKAMEALDNGFVDAVPENRETALYYIELNGWKLKTVGENILNHQNTTGYSKIYDRSVVDRHNIALESLFKDGSVDRLHKKYYGDLSTEYKR